MTIEPIYSIEAENIKNCGVYKIFCKANKKIYIGSSTNIIKRWEKHKRMLRNGKHSNLHLQNAWNLYGNKEFDYLVIEYCENAFLIDREQFYINKLKPEFNIRTTASSNAGIKASPETRKKISKAGMGNKYALGYKHSIETRIKMSNAKRNMSQETKEKISKSLVGNKRSLGYKQSPETLEKKSQSMNSERIEKIIQINTGNKYCLGRVISQETRDKIGLAHKGKKHSEETKAKMSKSHADRKIIKAIGEVGNDS